MLTSQQITYSKVGLPPPHRAVYHVFPCSQPGMPGKMEGIYFLLLC